MKKNLIILWILCLANTLFAQFTVDIQVSDPPKCANGTTGVLTAKIAGGTAPYTFLWNTGATTQVLFNQLAGTFSIQVTDGLGNIATDIATIVAPPSINVAITIIPADHWGNLNGGNNGQIQTTVTGGVAPYTYEYQLLRYTPMTAAESQSTMIGATALNAYWTGVDSTNRKYFVEDPTNLEPGNYKVVITDANGCAFESTTTIPNLNPITTNVLKDTTSCWMSNDAESGLGHIYGQGSHPFAYVNSNTPLTTVWMYDASFTDGLGVFHHVDSLIDGTLILDADTSIVFANGSFPGYNPATVNFEVNPTRVLNQGFYQGFWWTKIISSEGYEYIMYGTTTYPQSPLSLSVTFGTILCFGGTSFAEGSTDGSYGNYKWLWSSGEKTARINNKPAASYSVIVTDENGCQREESGKLTHPPKLKSKINQERLVSCYGDSTAKVVAEVSGGEGIITSTWSQTLGGPTVFTGEIFNNMWAGKWYLHMIDINNCQANDSINILQPKQLEVFVDNTSPVSCFGLMTGTAEFHHIGGTEPVTGQIFKDGKFFDGYRGFIYNLPEGEYTLELGDAHACPDSISFSIVQPEKIITDVFIEDSPCYGDSGTIIIKVTGGTNSFHLDPNITGTLLDDTTTFMVKLPKGDYRKIVVDDTTGCTVEISASISQPEPLRGEVKQLAEVKCPGDATASINQTTWGGTFPYTYLWSNGATSEDLIDIRSGWYHLTLTDKNLCERFDSIEIIQPDSLIIEVDTLTNASCYDMNDGVVIPFTQGGTQPWSITLYSNGKFIPSFRDLSAGSYTMYVEDRNKCIASTSFMINEPEEIVIEETIVDVLCYGESTGSISLETTGGYNQGFTYEWSNPPSNESTVINLGAGEYYVNITDNANPKCFKELKYSIIGPGQAPNINYVVEKRSRVRNPYGQTIAIKDGTIEVVQIYFFEVQPVNDNTFTLVNEKGEKQLWAKVPPNNYPIFYKLDTGVYYLTTISNIGCSWTSRIYVGLSNEEKLIPWWESFSPPGPSQIGDGKNDVWNIDPVYADKNPEVWIYNKGFGSLVYHSIGYNEPWNGKFNNKDKWCEQAIYNIIIEIDDGYIRKPLPGAVLLEYQRKGGY